MKTFKVLLILLICLIGMPTLSTFLYLIYKGVNLGTIVNLDNLSGLKNGNSIGTYLAAAFSALSSFLVVYALVQQNLDRKKNEAKDHFFKMVDYHNDTLKQISVPSLEIEKTHIEEGRRAFVPFKIQIKRLLELVKNSSMSNNFLLTENEIIDVAYMIFFYGLDRKWKGFIVEKLKIYPNHLALVDDIIIKIEDNPKLHLGRTNQTFLGVYFRNMYNAIKLVDSNNYLSNAEKKDLIKIYRAQISNPEFYVLFFNVISRFGKNWKKNKYITKYEFIRNIPKGYLDGYEPNDYFPMAYEHEE